MAYLGYYGSFLGFSAISIALYLLFTGPLAHSDDEDAVFTPFRRLRRSVQCRQVSRRGQPVYVGDDWYRFQRWL